MSCNCNSALADSEQSKDFVKNMTKAPALAMAGVGVAAGVLASKYLLNGKKKGRK